MTEINFYIILLFFSYFLVIISRKISPFFIVSSVVFIMLSFYLRSLVSFETNADYYGYYMLVQNDFELKVTSVFSEPYFPLAYTLIKSIIDGDRLFSEQALNSIYYINLCITIIFYLWLAILRDVRPWLKIFLFSFFLFFNRIYYHTKFNSIYAFCSIML